MVDTLTQVPAEAFAGDLLSWERDLVDYPASAWTLTYYFSSGDEQFSIQATASGDTHVAAETAANTAALKPGRYRWHARVDDAGGNVYTVDDGWLVILANPALGKVDWRSHARKMLDAIEAALEGQASKQQLDLINYTLGSVNVSRDRELLLKYRDRYLRELQNEDGNGASRRHTLVRFVSP